MRRVKIWMLILGTVFLILGVGVGEMTILDNLTTVANLETSEDSQANSGRATEMMNKTARLMFLQKIVGLVGLVLIIVSFRIKAK